MTDRAGPIELVAFDLDGTLLRGETVCEAIARELGRLDRMRELEAARTPEELRAGRAEMASWYEPYTIAELTAALGQLEYAPGTREAFAHLHDHGVTTAIVSLTWTFAVERFAAALGAAYAVGTALRPDGSIVHLLPRDKPDRVRSIAADLAIPMDRVAAVGDTASDAPMLAACGEAYFVGDSCPDTLDSAHHLPGAAIDDVAAAILDGSVSA